jgi:hypothetical protein
MTGWDIEAWQLSILVTAAIVLVEAAVNVLLRRRISLELHKRFRTGALGSLVVLTVIVFVAALGPGLADELSSVAAAVAAVVALWLTYRSYQAPRNTNLGGTGAPSDAPTVLPAPPPAAATVPALGPPPRPSRATAPPPKDAKAAAPRASPDAHPPVPSAAPGPEPAARSAGDAWSAGDARPGREPGAGPRPSVPGMRLRRLLFGRKTER